MTFDGCRVDGDALVGGVPGHGFAQVMSGLEVGRINVAARAVGVARAALEDSLAYAKERRTFGRAIVEHQAVAHKLADMATGVAAARELYLAAARKKDAGRSADLEAAMAKLFASEMCARATLDGIEIHGGYGYTDELRRRALLPRRAAVLRRRGDQRDPAHRDRPAAGAALNKLIAIEGIDGAGTTTQCRAAGRALRPAPDARALGSADRQAVARHPAPRGRRR